MFDWRKILGVGLGVILFCGLAHGLRMVLPVTHLSATPHGPLLSDCDGHIKKLVIQYHPEAGGIVHGIYREFLRQLPGDITVYLVSPDRSSAEHLNAQVGDTACTRVSVPVHHAMTCWSRDRWLAFSQRGPAGKIVIQPPFEELGAVAWEDRRGDARIYHDLVEAFPERIAAVPSRLVFDGGDFAADDQTVFVTPAVVTRNSGIPVRQLKDLLQQRFAKKVVLLSTAPEYHAGMFMMPIGNRRVLVGDPGLGLSLADRAESILPLDRVDRSADTRKRFDAVAQSCRKAGYHVIRIPTVPDEDGRTYLTYLNVIVDEYEGRKTVYMPVFRGAEILNAAAEMVWTAQGFKVVRIDCTNSYRHFGSLRCLVNVLEREDPPVGITP